MLALLVSCITERMIQRPGAPSKHRRLINDLDKVMHGDTTNAPIRSGISRCSDEGLIADRDCAIHVNRRALLLRLLH